jgi:DNA-binding MarR family transcriptional regulator
VPRNELADQVWRQLSTLVADNMDAWRRAVVERTRLPFSRIRIMRRLAVRPMTVKQIAAAAAMDAPAATVAVNDLEQRGLVLRRVNPENRRCKLVSLTDAGREVVALVEAVEDPAPAVLAALSAKELRALRGLMERLATGRPDPSPPPDSSSPAPPSPRCGRRYPRRRPRGEPPSHTT